MGTAIGVLFVLARYLSILAALHYLFTGQFDGCVASVAFWYLCGKEAETWLDGD